MLDKVELRVPGRTPFQPDFQWIEKEVPFAGQASPIRRSVRYQGAVDLRPFGFDAMLHAYFKRKIRGPHKLELFRTGSKSLAEMTRIVAAIFDADPNNLENMRLDFTADLHDIPVEYLHNSVRVKFKRSSNEHGEMDYEEIGHKRLEYFRYGVSPNCVRVYDKVAECKARLPEVARANRKARPSFFREQLIPDTSPSPHECGCAGTNLEGHEGPMGEWKNEGKPEEGGVVPAIAFPLLPH